MSLLADRPSQRLKVKHWRGFQAGNGWRGAPMLGLPCAAGNMSMNETYASVEPGRAEMDALAGPAMIEFGSPWCGHCRAAQPLIAAALESHPSVRHFKIADGPGQPLGRSFKVKLWPTLIFLDSGKERSRLVRPTDPNEIAEALAEIDTASR
jgi:thioredoxin 1